MIQEIKDRVPVNVLSNDAIRYGIYDEQGNLVRYEYIKREDEPSENGTPINKGLFNNLQGDLYTVDRYNKTEVSAEVVKSGLFTDNLFADMEQIDAKNCKNFQCSVTVSNGIDSIPLYNVFDGTDSTSWMYSSTPNWIKAKFISPIKITKMSLKTSGTSEVKIEGSNDDISWDTLYTASGSVSTIATLNNNQYYKYYRLYLTGGSSQYVYRWEVREYEGDYYDTKMSLDIPLTSYEVGKIVNIEGSSYIGTAEVTKTGNLFNKTWTKVSDTEYTSNSGDTLFVNGHNASYVPTNMFDNDVNSSYVTPDSSNPIVKIKLSEAKKITKMNWKYDVNGASSNIISMKVQGSNDNEHWIDLYSTPSNTTFPTLFEITLANTDFYEYYQLNFELKVEDNGLIVYEWQTSEYMEIEDGVETTSFKNPYININNLGAKQINGTIEAGEKYSLVYNGESWDVKKTKVVTGNFTAATSYVLQSVDVGFEPDIVICYQIANNNNLVAGTNPSGTGTMGYNYQIPRIITKAFSHTYSKITSNGFAFAGASDSIQVYYIAIKF